MVCGPSKSARPHPWRRHAPPGAETWPPGPGCAAAGPRLAACHLPSSAPSPGAQMESKLLQLAAAFAGPVHSRQTGYTVQPEAHTGQKMTPAGFSSHDEARLTPGLPARVSCEKQPRHWCAVTGLTGKPSSASSMAGCSTCASHASPVCTSASCAHCFVFTREAAGMLEAVAAPDTTSSAATLGCYTHQVSRCWGA